MPYNIKVISKSLLCVDLIQPWWPHLWRLNRPIEYVWEWDLGIETVTIPINYECDGASIPFRFYDTVDPINALPGAFIHDILYETCGGTRLYKLCDGSKRPLTLSFVNQSDRERRSRSDALLKEFWLYDNMPNEQAEKGYLAVRLFGSGPWNDTEPEPQDTPLLDKITEELGSRIE